LIVESQAKTKKQLGAFYVLVYGPIFGLSLTMKLGL